MHVGWLLKVGALNPGQDTKLKLFFDASIRV